MASALFYYRSNYALSLQGRNEGYILGEQPAEEEDERYVYKHLEH